MTVNRAEHPTPDNAGSEFRKFDTAMGTILSVSREELKKREKAWKHKQAKKRRAKT
jgi:hypothetical protein